MKKPSALKLLKNFEPDEISEFRKFLESPFFNNNKPILIVYNCILEKQNYLAVNGYDEIINHILKKTSYTKKTTAKILSLLNERILTYYAVKNTLSDSVFTSTKLNQYLLRKGEYFQLNKCSQSADNILRNKNLNFDNLYNSYLHKKNLIYSFIADIDYWKNKSIFNTFELANSAMFDLYLFFLMELISRYMDLIFQRINTGIKELPDIPVDLKKYMDSIEIYLNSNKVEENKLILYNLNKYIFGLLNNLENNEKYDKYKKYFFNNIEYFDNSLIAVQIDYLMNYCTIRERLGGDINFFKSEGLKMLTYYIDNDYYKDSMTDFLHPELYHNFISSCMRLSETKRLKIFIEKNTVKLHPDYFEEMSKFALAHLYYLKKEYPLASRCLADIKLKHFMFKFDLLILELKIYYYVSINDVFKTELIEKIIHNFDKTLKEDKHLTGNDKKKIKKFVYYYREYLSLWDKFSRDDKYFKDILKLKKDIDGEKSFASKKWLGDEIDLVIAQHNVKMQSV